MKKKIVALIITLVFSMSFSACGAVDSVRTINESKREVNGEDNKKENKEENKEEDNKEVDDDKNKSEDNGVKIKDFKLVTDENDVIKYSFAGDSDWKKAYHDQIKKERNKMENFDFGDDYYENFEGQWEMDHCNGYKLYDVDKDGIPELIISYGTCEADYHDEVYTYDNGLKDVGLIYTGHSGIYSDPDKNGMLIMMAHSGYQCIDEVTLVDGKLSTESIYEKSQYDENGNYIEGEDYSEPDEVVEGSVYINSCRLDDDISIDFYEYIEKVSTGENVSLTDLYNKGENAIDKRNSDYEKASEFYENIYTNNGYVYAIAADDYTKSLGFVTFDNILAEDTIYPYTTGSLAVVSKDIVDIDNNGSFECVLILKDEESSYFSVLLNLQEGTVYAYLEAFESGLTIREDGVYEYKSEYYELCKKAVFSYDQICWMNCK